jgi:hypothetical protein
MPGRSENVPQKPVQNDENDDGGEAAAAEFTGAPSGEECTKDIPHGFLEERGRREPVRQENACMGAQLQSTNSIVM